MEQIKDKTDEKIIKLIKDGKTDEQIALVVK